MSLRAIFPNFTQERKDLKGLDSLPITIYADGLRVSDFVHLKIVIDVNLLSMESRNAIDEVFNIEREYPSFLITCGKGKKILFIGAD